jgi:hypothetical protein
MTTYSIYLEYTYSIHSASFWYLSHCGMTMVYSWFMPWPYRNVTGTKMMQKVLSRCIPGIYCMSSYERFLHVLYQVYIPGMYYLHGILHEYKPGINLLYDIFIVIYQVFARYMINIFLVVGAVEPTVEVDMDPCSQSHQQWHHRA